MSARVTPRGRAEIVQDQQEGRRLAAAGRGGGQQVAPFDGGGIACSRFSRPLETHSRRRAGVGSAVT
jgi:hypothetical protein